MAQTTDGMSGVANTVEHSPDGAAWTDISGYANQVNVDPQTRKSGVAYTFDGDTGIITFGKREPMLVRVRIIYTEDGSSPFDALLTIFETAPGTAFYLRWSPKGSDTGDFEFTTPISKISEFNFPSVDGESADPLMVEFAVGPVASIAKSLATT